MNHSIIANEISEPWERDFNQYLQFVSNRSLYTDSFNLDKLKSVYKKIFIYTTLSNKIESLRTRGNLKYFYNECRNNLIISYDLLNFNYISSSKQILRSAIESYFRLSLALEQINYYDLRKKNGMYTVDDKLRDLKSLQDSHKVGKLTAFLVDYYRNSCVYKIFNRLNELYSNLSGNVHVNKQGDFTPHKYLSDYNELQIAVFEEALNILEEVCELIVQGLYYYSSLLEKFGLFFEKREISLFESSIKYMNLLDKIDSK